MEPVFFSLYLQIEEKLDSVPLRLVDQRKAWNLEQLVFIRFNKVKREELIITGHCDKRKNGIG